MRRCRVGQEPGFTGPRSVTLLRDTRLLVFVGSFSVVNAPAAPVAVLGSSLARDRCAWLARPRRRKFYLVLQLSSGASDMVGMGMTRPSLTRTRDERSKVSAPRWLPPAGRACACAAVASNVATWFDLAAQRGRREHSARSRETCPLRARGAKMVLPLPVRHPPRRRARSASCCGWPFGSPLVSASFAWRLVRVGHRERCAKRPSRPYG